eukprot:scaffold51563_cov63-Phaeocystis_antarctica.AAC.2
MEVAMWSTSDLITNLTFFDDPNSMTPTKAFVNDKVDPDSTRNRDPHQAIAWRPRGCAEISPQSAATAPSYQEFQLAPRVECLKYTRIYPCCADEPWTQLWIVFHIQRSYNYYILLIEMPSIVITVLSFGQFWMDASAIGSRLGFGATMFLTSYVLLSVSEDSLPRCGELLWINYLNVLTLTFCVLVSDRHSNLGPPICRSADPVFATRSLSGTRSDCNYGELLLWEDKQGAGRVCGGN